MSEEQLRNELYDILVDILSVERQEVTPSARFFADLGGESIELLELSFRCEKKFGISSLQFDRMLSPEDVQRDSQGRLTPQSAAALRTRFPSLDVGKLDAGAVSPASLIQELLTVGVIHDYLRQRLSSPAGAPATGN